MGVVLWLMAAILVIVGIVQLFQGQIILGIVLIVVGCLVGPGGYSIFQRPCLTCPASLAAPRPSSATTIKAGVHRRSSSHPDSPAG